MPNKKKASPVGDLSSGYESDTVKEYDPSATEGQLGKEHEEEVAPSNNWENDDRDAVGKAANKNKRLAKRLRRIANEIEAMNAEYQDDVEEVQDAVEKEPEADEKKSSKDEKIIKDATEGHPMEQDPSEQNPEADMSAQTGDDEWIDIGQGEFDDARDEIGRAL